MSGEILVVALDCADQRLLDNLTRGLSVQLRTRATRADWSVPLDYARDSARGQYNSALILGELHRHTVGLSVRILGVTDRDLFTPILTYLFGEAQLNGPTAVVSTYRLRPELYGLPSNAPLLERRLLVEAIHELGHTAGLTHCARPDCAMAGSTYAEEIDLKEPGFCDDCRVRFDRSFEQGT